MLKTKRFVLFLLVLGLVFFSAGAPDAAGEDAPSPEAGKKVYIYPNLIINGDDRMVVSNPESFPFSCITFMDVICQCGCGWECSGSLVGNGHTVLTAAHCVYCAEHSAPAESIIFYFGYHSYHKNLCRYDGHWSLFAGTTFETHEYSFQDDWAVIRLDEDVGSQTGFLQPLCGISEEEALSPANRILGYSAGALYMDQGLLQLMDETHFLYAMDQDSGASGGPILNQENQIIGIVIGHLEEDDGSQYNVGHRLTPEILGVIEESGKLSSDIFSSPPGQVRFKFSRP